ncbi:MAG: hypothetical protein ACI92S_005050, partial [Planctomycetaceae bacterium]
ETSSKEPAEPQFEAVSTRRSFAILPNTHRAILFLKC